MTRWSGIARTPPASGRFLFPLILALTSCRLAGPPVGKTTAPAWPDPVVQVGETSAQTEQAAADLFVRAQSALSTGDAARAHTLATEVVNSYPASRVSGRALRLVAEADLALKDWTGADEAATRYIGLLEAGDPRAEEARILQNRAREGARSAESRVEKTEPVAPAPMQTVDIATVLPLGGSPGFKEFAGLIAEGVEVAAATALQGSAEVQVDAHDDRGDAGAAAAAVTEIEGTDALGAVGFLEATALDAAAQARRGPLPLVSPTARVEPGEGTYTLSGADPAAAVAMARYAARAGFKRVAVIHSRASESTKEADAFVDALREEGIPLAGRFAYDAGSTFFEAQIKGARDALRADEIAALGLGPDDTLHVEVLDPVAVFLPIPAEDVELVAPQVTFYGLDTLAIRTLGTSGWTDPETLATVDRRHTTGVVATAPMDAGPGSAGYARFRRAYESHFRRTLVSPVPALGYDAALLLLEAGRSGVRSPMDMRAALERTRDLEGATGIISVLDGRVVRRTHIVQIEDGTLKPVG